MKKILMLTLALVLLLGLIATPVMAGKPGGQQDALNDSLTLGADLHLSRQGTYSGVDNTWEWVIGSGSGGGNIQGISATGLLAAYERTGDTDYLDGAIAAGDTLVARYEAAIADGVQWGDRPYSQDIEFLVRLSRDSKDRSYARVATDWYDIIISIKTAEENVDRYITARGSLSGWDLASQIRAVLDTGNRGYARDMAEELIERSDDWVNVPYPNTVWDATNYSYGSLLWALHEVGGFQTTINDYRQFLLGIQEDDGSWKDGDDSDYQLVAYIMLGLSAVQGKGSKDALASAGTFLISSQTEDGGWSYPPEYGEVNSEVLMALGDLKVDEGLHKGKIDPNPERGKDIGKHPLDPVP